MNCKKAIILAAGTASRLRPLTSNTPKCLLKVGERTLLERSMDALIKAGIREFVIVTGYLHEQIENFVQQTYGESICVRFIHNKDYETTNNIYSLWLARPKADGEEVLLLDSDLLYDGEIIERVLTDSHENVLTLIRHELGEEEMKVVIAPSLPSLEGKDPSKSPLKGETFSLPLREGWGGSLGVCLLVKVLSQGLAQLIAAQVSFDDLPIGTIEDGCRNALDVVEVAGSALPPL